MAHPYDEFAGYTFSQWAAIGVKIGGRDIVELALRDEVKFVRKDNEIEIVATKSVPQAPKPEAIDISSFFQATKAWETANSIVFHVRAKRGQRTPQQLLELTGRKLYTNDANDVVSTMPLVSGESADWEEFDFEMLKVGKRIGDAQVEKERVKRNSTRDLEVQILINALFPEFADQHPNGDSWQDADGKWCFAGFYRGGGGRYVIVDRNALGWYGLSWFGGRK